MPGMLMEHRSDRLSADAVGFYDRLWAGTTRVDQHHKCRILAIERVLERLARRQGNAQRILELGCGSGIVAAMLARHGEVTGVDQSGVGIEIARQRVKGTFVVGTLPAIPIDEGDFDVCVLTQVLEHLERHEQTELLRNALRKTRPGGAIIVTTPNRAVSTAMQFARGELQPIEAWLDGSELRDMLESAGWRVGRIFYAFNFFPVAASRHPWVRALRFLVYDVLMLRRTIESAMARSRRGDCMVAVARRP